MDRIARVIVTHSRRILALTGAITLLALLMLFRMDFNGDVASFVLEGNETGEAFKTLETFSWVIDALVAARMHRDATVVALGGGVGTITGD